MANMSNYNCQCGKCESTPAPAELIAALDYVERAFGKPVHITSGKRCHEHNAKVGGAPLSRHTGGEACDFFVKGVEPAAIYRVLDEAYPHEYGVGLYRTHVHVDVRPYRSRWGVPG